jgi:hypothetical protein
MRPTPKCAFRNAAQCCGQEAEWSITVGNYPEQTSCSWHLPYLLSQQRASEVHWIKASKGAPSEAPFHSWDPDRYPAIVPDETTDQQ